MSWLVGTSWLCAADLVGLWRRSVEEPSLKVGPLLVSYQGRPQPKQTGYVDIPIFTSMGYSRNVIVVHTGQAVIAVGGAFGTLSEIGHALSDGIPVIGLKTWPLTKNGDGVDIGNSIIQAESPADAVTKALTAAANKTTDNLVNSCMVLKFYFKVKVL
ncbi:MAG: hypothetical protein CM1200mP27_04410 [Chloroflexota bacterium]|nr:MAG: hypothetical protein CM1200mP27_04410 [Chloroflexota bacterium]